MLTSFIAFIIVIAVCVVIHEFGHFITARLLGVQVHEFAFGMGPVIKQRVQEGKSRMLWSWRLLPVGGFCRLAGMGEDEDDETVLPGMGFNEQSAWKRFLILLNGSLFNIILALLLTTIFLCGHGVLDMYSTKIGTIMAGFPSESAGLQVGDRITAVNGREVTEWREMSNAIREEAEKSDEPIKIAILRDKKILTLEVKIPMNAEYQRPMLGISPSYMHYGLIEAFKNSAGYIWHMTASMLRGMADWVFQRQEVDVTGPIGIASMSGRAMRDGLWSFVTFLSLISLNLGLLNLFPIPALDGGRILFVILEMIFRRRLPEKVENWIHTVGFMLLISLMIFITYKDIRNIFFTH